MAQRQAVNSLMLATLRQIVRANEEEKREAQAVAQRYGASPASLQGTKMGFLLGAMRPGVRYTNAMVKALVPDEWRSRIASQTMYSLCKAGYVRRFGRGGGVWYERRA